MLGLINIKIKKLVPEAVIPSYSKDGDAGQDFTAVSKRFDEKGNTIYGCGVAVEILPGFVGLLFPRSSISNYTLSLTNAVGVVDSGYRGEIMCKFKPTHPSEVHDYEVGDRVCQMIILPYPQVKWEEVSELSISERGTGSYGSSGN